MSHILHGPPGPSRSSGAESTDSPTEILIVDDHPAIREALSAAIEREEGLQVVGAFDNVVDVEAYLEERTPDILVVDITLGGEDGLTLIEHIRTESPETRVLVYSMHDESLYAGRALRAGAMGYVPKSAPTDDVIEAIHQIEQGDVYLSRQIASQVLGKVIHNHGYAANPVEQLTDREMTVFRMIGQGYSVREIAEELDLSRKTVETYRRRAKEKLGYESVDELLRFAVQWAGRNPEDDG